MHEVSIIENVINIAVKEAEDNKLKTINKISLKIGELSGVMKDSLVFAFQGITKGTALEKTKLNIERVKATAHCLGCNATFEIARFNKLCPNCKEFCSNVLTGYELYIDSIEGDN